MAGPPRRARSGWTSRPGSWPSRTALQAEFGLRFPLVQADAERVPVGAGRAGLVISEYGASVWCDPYRWIPEAARLLRPGGRLVFTAQSTLARMDDRRVRAARTARSAHDSRGYLTSRCRTAIWWRSIRISVFLTLSERVSRASQPRSRKKIR